VKLESGEFSKFAALNFESAGTADEFLEALYPRASRLLNAMPIAGAVAGGAVGGAAGWAAQPLLQPASRMFGPARPGLARAATIAAADMAPQLGAAAVGALGHGIGGVPRSILKRMLGL